MTNANGWTLGAEFRPGGQPDDGKFPDEDVERGTAFTRWDAMWATWANGAVMDAGEWESADLNNMLKRYGQARTVENVLTLPLNQLKWKCTPAKGDRGESEFINNFLISAPNQGGSKTPFPQILQMMTSAVTHKRATFEKIFTVYDGHHVYKDVAWRPQTTTSIVRNPENAGFEGFAQEAVTEAMQKKTGGLPIRIEAKYAFAYFHNSKRDPINGISDMEIPFWCYKTQQKVLFLFFNYLETMAMGKTVVEASDLGRAMQIAKQVGQAKGGAVIPVSNTSGANQKIYSLDVATKGSGDYMAAIKYLDHMASGAVLAGFVDLTDVSTGGRGSMALSKDQTDFFLMSRQAVAAEMAWFVRNYLIADLVYYNFGVGASVPMFEFEPLGDREIDQAVSLLNGALLAPPAQVPQGWVELLAEAVAPSLNLDVDKVTAAFGDTAYKAQRKAAAAGAPPAVQGLAGVAAPVQLGTKMVKSAKALA